MFPAISIISTAAWSGHSCESLLNRTCPARSRRRNTSRRRVAKSVAPRGRPHAFAALFCASRHAFLVDFLSLVTSVQRFAKAVWTRFSFNEFLATGLA